MLTQIFSKVNPEKLLHSVYRPTVKSNRIDLAPPEQFLQLSIINPSHGKKYDKHYHIWKTPSFDKTIAQESWVIISGSVRVSFYDTDNQLLQEEIIGPGECSMTFEGGHTYEILEENTSIYEFKTGPYNGRENDKQFF
jgi:hypothetical protein